MSSNPDSGHSPGTVAVQILEVTEKNAGQRLDNFLLGKLKGVPKSLFYRKIRKGEVRINGKRAKPDSRVQLADKVRVPPLRLPSRDAPPAPGAELRQRLIDAILYQDESLMVLNKLSGLAVHAGSGQKLGLIEGMRAIFPEIEGLELVHRLDKGTSGCLLLAKTGKARKALMEGFRVHEVNKIYHLLVAGHWPKKIQRVNFPLQRQQERNGERLVESDPNGKAAVTHFTVLEKLTQASLLEARPETGRTHQIRVHATQSGYPLLGDDKYHTPASQARSHQAGIKRLCLHAAGLEFRHPDDGRLMSVTAPYDVAFEASLRSLRAGG